MSDTLLVELRRSLVRPFGLLMHTERTLLDLHLVLMRRLADGVRALSRSALACSMRWRTVRPRVRRASGHGLAGEAIPLGSRIVAVCDVYGAMTSERPYRPALSHEDACRELHASVGSQFDPAVVQACLDDLLAAEREEFRDPVRDAADHVRTLLGSAR